MIASRPKTPPPLYRHDELPEPVPFKGSLKAWVEVERECWSRGPAYLVQMVAEGDHPIRVSCVWTFQVRRGGTRRLAERFARAIEAGLVATEMELRTDVWGKPFVSIREVAPWTEAEGHGNYCLALAIELGRHGIHAGPRPNLTHLCPLCGADLCSGPIPPEDQWLYGNRTHFLRRISIVDRDLDRAIAYRCPDCGGTWPREK